MNAITSIDFTSVELQQLPTFNTNKILSSTIPLFFRYEQIKSGAGFASGFNMQRSRTFTKIDPQTNKVIPEYARFKGTLPIVVPHSICKGHEKVGTNVECLTGILFYEWDCPSKEHANAFKSELVYKYGHLASAIYITASGEGVALYLLTNLINRTDIDSNQFKSLYFLLGNRLGFNDKYLFDTQCADIVRNSCLSYDVDIFVNPKSIVQEFNREDFVLRKRQSITSAEPIPKAGGNSVSNYTSKEEYIDTELPPNNLPKNGVLPISLNEVIELSLREITEEEQQYRFVFNNSILEDECDAGQDYMVFDEKKPFYYIFKRRYKKEKIQVGSRTNVMLAICSCLILNNAKLFDEKREKALPKLYRILNSENRCHCADMLTEKEICSIVRSCYNYYIKGLLTSKYIKYKRIAWKAGTRLTAKQKQSIGARVVNEHRGKLNTIKIEQAFNLHVELNGVLPTQIQMVEKTGYSKRTIRSRWRILINLYPHLARP